MNVPPYKAKSTQGKATALTAMSLMLLYTTQTWSYDWPQVLWAQVI